MKNTLCRNPEDVKKIATEMFEAAEKYSEKYCLDRDTNPAKLGEWMFEVGLTRVIQIVKNGNELNFSICLSKDDAYTLSMLQFVPNKAKVPDEWANVIVGAFVADRNLEVKEEKSPTLTRYFTIANKGLEQLLKDIKNENDKPDNINYKWN